jgi:hypothetical protein
MSGSPKDSSGRIPASVTRRSVLRGGSAGILSVVFFRHGDFSFTAEAKPGNARKRSSDAPLALGFNHLDSSIIDPVSIAAGDARLVAEGALFKILGLQPFNKPESLATLDWMTIDVVYADHPGVPFLAWTYRSDPVPQESAPYSVRVPVSLAGMQLLVSYRMANGAGPVQYTVRLVAGTESGLPKLKPGTYLLALPGADQSLPNWKTHQLLNVTGDDGCEHRCLHEKVRSSYVQSGRPHVLVSIG